MRFTYRKGFWVLLVFSFVLAIYQFGKSTSLEVDLAFKKMNLAFLKSDTHAIGEIATKRIYTRTDIEQFLDKNYNASDGVRKNGDTLFLSKSYMIFKNDSLISIVVN